MFKVNNKNTKTTFIAFTLFSSVSIVDFEQKMFVGDALKIM